MSQIFSETGKRNDTISCIRLISMCFIVLCHIMQYYDCKLAWWFNVGVQIFLCISGYLYGARESTSKYFFVRSFSKILISYYIVFLIFGAIHFFFLKTIGMKALCTGLFTFVRLPGGGHLWFIFTILCCYVITPLLYALLKKSDTPKLFWVKAIFALVASHLFFSHASHIILQLSFNPAWINCYILGFILARVTYRTSVECNIYIGSIVGLCLICNAVKVYMLCTQKALVWESNILFNYSHVFLGISVFVLFGSIFNKIRLKGSLLRLSDKYSYEVYLTHHYFILGPLSLLSMTDYHVINVIFIFCIICMLSYLINKISLYCRSMFAKLCCICNIY